MWEQGEFGGFDSGGLEERGDFRDHIGIEGGNIVGFIDVGGEVVEMDGGLGIFGEIKANGFEGTHADGLLFSLLMEFPIEVGMLFLLGGLSQERREKGDSIGLARDWNLGKFAEGGEKIPVGGEVIGAGVGGDFAGPSGEERNTDAAFVEVAFVASEGTVAVEEIGLVPAFFMGSVVGGEEDEGVGVQVEGAEEVEDLSYSAIQAGHHGGESSDGVGDFGALVSADGFLELWEDFAKGLDFFFGDMHGGVGDGHGEVGEEG